MYDPHVYTRLHVYVSTRLYHTPVHVYTQVHILYICTCVRIYAHVQISVRDTRVSTTRAHTPTYMTHVHTRKCLHVYTVRVPTYDNFRRGHVYIHKYTRVHTPTRT